MERRVVRGRFINLGTLGLAAAMACSGWGCGSKNSYPNASVYFDARPETQAETGTTTRPPPAIVAGNKLLVAGQVLMIGNGPDTCTNQDPATGDRWCGFTLPSIFPGATDLWVINISKAAAGKAIRCDASDLDCLRLTSTLVTSDLTIHRFFGDTLIYYADSNSDGTGPVAAWRPGWTAGRKLTSSAGIQCAGHPKADVAICFQNSDATSVAGQTSTDLVAGRLPADGNTPLPKVDTLITRVTSDPTGTRKYQVGLSPEGDWVGWSSRLTANGKEILRAQKVNDDASRVTVADDVSRWVIARDNLKWYWLKTFNYSISGAPSGTLQMATFPTVGAGPATAVDLKTNVGTYGTAGDKGIIYLGGLSNGLGDLTVMIDRDMPAQIDTLDSGVQRVLDVSRDGRTVLYSKSSTFDGLFDLYLGGIDLATPCTLSSIPLSPPPFATLSNPATFAFWANFDDFTGEVVGNYTTVATCSTHKFASDIWFWTSIQDQGVVFGDQAQQNPLTGVDLTLRFAQFSGAALPATGTVVQERADVTFAALLPTLPAVVFAVLVGDGVDGLYLKSDLPFPATGPVTPPDGGAPDASGGN